MNKLITIYGLAIELLTYNFAFNQLFRHNLVMRSANPHLVVSVRYS